jgi:hypothetical protein
VGGGGAPIEINRQSLHLENTHFTENEKCRTSMSQVKAMMIIDTRGIIVIKYVPEGQTVNEKYYLEVLTKLQERVKK